MIDSSYHFHSNRTSPPHLHNTNTTIYHTPPLSSNYTTPMTSHHLLNQRSFKKLTTHQYRHTTDTTPTRYTPILARYCPIRTIQLHKLTPIDYKPNPTPLPAHFRFITSLTSHHSRRTLHHVKHTTPHHTTYSGAAAELYHPRGARLLGDLMRSDSTPATTKSQIYQVGCWELLAG